MKQESLKWNYYLVIKIKKIELNYEDQKSWNKSNIK